MTSIRAYLLLTAGVSGAMVMVVEVMGSRVLGPFFGVSLFVWTSLIAVTLGSLAAGYALGGVLADRREAPDLLYGLVFLAGLAALGVPFLKGPVLRACGPLDIRLGALAASLLLFGPCLLLLGCVTPWLVKLAARDLGQVGRTVGLVSAISTLGSLVGTLATGFVLIARLGVGQTFSLVGGLLILLAVGYAVLFRGRWAALLLLAVPLLGPDPASPVSRVMPNGTRVTEIARREGFYGRVQVVDYTYGTAHTREMLIDGLIQGGIDVATGLSVYEHVYFLEHLPLALRPEARSCLVVGLGPGLVPAWLESRGVRTDVVEINPDVVDLAREHFDYRPAGRLVLSDARRFLDRPGKRYDLVILDVFTGDTTPGHLLTVEALGAVRDRLADRGLLAVNMAGSLREHTLGTASIIRTLEQVFTHVQIHPTFSPEENGGYGNLIVMASRARLGPIERARVEGLPVHPLARPAVERYLPRTFRFTPDTPALVLTDDYQPTDVLDAWLKERIRRGLLDSTDWRVLS